MNKENAHLFLPLVQALADGKIIQYQAEDESWLDYSENHDLSFAQDARFYRIKPEPRTFEMWYYKPTGRMYPWVEEEKQYAESDEWERITVQGVIK